MKPALLFWCQHSVGLGHLARAHALCTELVERFRVVLVCGGALPEGIAPPAGVDVVALPPLGIGPAGSFVSHDPRLSVTDAWTVRRKRLLAAYEAARPSVVLVELWPFGRAKFGRELLPLLECARQDGVPAFCSVRGHPRQPPRGPARARRARVRARQRTPRRGARAQRPALRAPGAHVRTAGAAPRPGPPYRLRGRRAPGAGRRATRRRRGLGGRRARRSAAAARGAGSAADPLAADRPPDAPDRRSLPPGPRPGCAGRRSRDRAGRDARSQRPHARRRARPRGGVGQPVRLQHRARADPVAGTRAGGPLRDAVGGRAATPRPPAGATRRPARVGPVQLTPETLARAIVALDGFVPALAGLDVEGARTTTELLWAQRRTEARVA